MVLGSGAGLMVICICSSWCGSFYHANQASLAVHGLQPQSHF